MKWGNAKFKLGYEFAVELVKPDDFCEVTDSLWLGPVFKELMLCHGGMVSIRTNVYPNKFKVLQKDVTLLQAQ